MTIGSLPKGIHDRAGVEYEVELALLMKAKTRSEKFGCSPIVTAPIGFEETFLAGRDDFRDRAYTLVDKGGRNLMLTPDSSPLIVRWIADKNRNRTPQRLFFTSPVFRYRNQRYRHFRHIGFAFGNTARNIQEENLTLTTVLDLMAQFFREDCDHPISIVLSDLGIWHTLLSSEMQSHQDRRSLLHKLRFSQGQVSESLLSEKLKNSKLIDVILRLLSTGQLLSDGSGQASARYARLNHLREIISIRTGVRVDLDLGNLRGSEIQDSIVAQFKNDRGELCGDGGCYSNYARVISPSIRSFFSVATGLEYLVENQRLTPGVRTLCIMSFHDVLDLAQNIECSLRANGVSVIVQPVTRALAATARALSPGVEWVSVLGKHEYLRNQLQIQNLTTGVMRTVTINELVALTPSALLNLFCTR